MKKTIIVLITILSLFLLAGCDLEILLPSPEISLTSPANGATDVSLKPTLSWQANGATRYRLYLGEAQNNLNIIKTINNPEIKSFTIVTPLETGTTYYWKVTALNDFDQSSSTGVREFKTLSTGEFRALTVGVSNYDRQTDLPLASNDADAIEDTLQNWSEDYTVQKLKDYVTRLNLVNELNFIIDAGSTAEDIFLFHFSGHGFYDGESNILLSDDRSMSVTELKEKLDQINGTKIIIIDSCESGSFTNLTPSRSQRRKQLKDFNTTLINVFKTEKGSRGAYTSDYEYYVFTGAKFDEASYEDSDLNHGLFSFFFMDGVGNTGVANPFGPFNDTYNADGYLSSQPGYGPTDDKVSFHESLMYSKDKVYNYTQDYDYPTLQNVQGYPVGAEGDSFYLTEY